MATRFFQNEDINAILVDLGSRSVRIGHAGSDSPLFDIHSVFGQYPSNNEPMAITDSKKKSRYFGPTYLLSKNAQQMNIKRFIRKGLITDWTAFEEFMDFLYEDLMRIDSSEHPVMFSEHPLTPNKHKQKLCELMFEKFKVPAVQIIKHPSLSLFSQGKSNGVIVDLGHDSIMSAPVVDGFVVTKAVLDLSKANGRKMLDVYKKVLGINDESLIPQNLANSGVQMTDSYRKYITACTLMDLCGSTLQAYEQDTYDANVLEQMPRVTYELPDKTVLDIGEERYRIPEVMFDPARFSIPTTVVGDDELAANLPLIISNSIGQCDADVRHPLYANIFVLGGCSQMPGLVDRLTNELTAKHPTVTRLKVITPANVNDRRYSTYIGASILASMSGFKYRWLTSHEYASSGNYAVDKKCASSS